MAPCGTPVNPAERLDETDPNSHLHPRALDEVLPWDHVDCGVTKRYLLQERERADRGEFTPDCRGAECHSCGACDRGRDGA